MAEERSSKSTSLVSSALKHIRKKKNRDDFISIKRKEIQFRMKNRKRWPKSKKRVVFLSHIPRGFTEETMREYFEQFGEVTNIRLDRNMKTGNIKGHAFIEFRHEVVAQIVAETMNNYVLFNRLLKAEAIKFPGSKYKSRLDFWEKYKGNPKLQNIQKKKVKLNKKVLSKEVQAQSKEERLIMLVKSIDKLKEKGILYDYKPALHQELPGYGPPDPGKFIRNPDPDTKIDGVNEEKPVLEVDESDDEIQFMTPPNVIKKKLCVLNTSPKGILNTSKLDIFKVKSKSRKKDKNSKQGSVTPNESLEKLDRHSKFELLKESKKEKNKLLKLRKAKNLITSMNSVQNRSEKGKSVKLEGKKSNELKRKEKINVKTSQKEHSIKIKELERNKKDRNVKRNMLLKLSTIKMLMISNKSVQNKRKKNKIKKLEGVNLEEEKSNELKKKKKRRVRNKRQTRSSGILF